MKTNFVRAALAGAALMITSTAALAAFTPVQGTPIILEHDPAGIVAHGTTDADGRVTFTDLKPGKYVIVIAGKDLVAAMDKLAPPPEKSGGMSLSIGGGLFGGGHSSSGHQGAGPASGGGSGSGGGVGAGISVPLGGNDNSQPPQFSDRVRFEAEIGWDRHDAQGDRVFSVDMPFCPDSNGDVRLGFTVPKSANAADDDDISLSLRWRH